MPEFCPKCGINWQYATKVGGEDVCLTCVTRRKNREEIIQKKQEEQLRKWKLDPIKRDIMHREIILQKFIFGEEEWQRRNDLQKS